MKISLFRAVTIMALGTLLACSPVKFSANSSDNHIVTPGGDGAGDGGADGGGDGNGDGGGTPILRDVIYSQNIKAKDTKLDIVLIIDDSNSMLADNLKLANRLQGFVSKLQSESNLDWQMCVTTTREVQVGNGRYWGASHYWQSNAAAPSNALGIILKRGTANLNNIFKETIKYIGAGWENSNDERAIKAAYAHVYNGDLSYGGNSGCYRADSAVSYLIISDEDERSIGGDISQKYYADEYKPLEHEDYPQNFVNYFKQVFPQKRMTVNSIIVKPGDTDCMTIQDAKDANGQIIAKAHYGFRYAELSNLTAGGIGSICDNDFSTSLNLFIDKINNSLSSIALECSPYNGNVTVNITPNYGTVTSRLEGANLRFETPIPAGHRVEVRYQCEETRTPSSVTAAVPQAEPGFFGKIWNFIKGLFL